MSILAVCTHAAKSDASSQVVAALQAEALREKAANFRVARAIPLMERSRKNLESLGASLVKGECELISGVEPQAFAHPWDEIIEGKAKSGK